MTSLILIALAAVLVLLALGIPIYLVLMGVSSVLLVAEGRTIAGLLIKSFAKGASSSDFNIVLWAWTDNKGSLEVVDDEERLSRM